jgi:hypothetical protein
MRLELHVRRFFCDTADCPQQIFAERVPSVVACYARRTQRLEAWFTAIGLALGGEAGARLLAVLGLTASPDTLLARIRALPLQAADTPRVLGVDDWSFRKGRTFGTILVDLEPRQVIDLLPDREVSTLATWLQRHPGIEIISRDRGGAYAEGARLGAPAALQVADRWHLLHNLWEVLEGFFVHRKHVLRTLQNSGRRQIVEATPWLTGRTLRSEERSIQRHTRFIELYEQIRDLHTKGADIRQIARQLQISRGTVYRYLRMQQPPTRAQCPVPHPLPLDAYKPYLLRRWNESCRSATRLWRELAAQGYTQARCTVARFIGLLRIETGQRKKCKTAPAAQLYDEQDEQLATARPLTTRQAARLLLTAEAQRTSSEQTRLAQLLAADPEIARAYEHAQGFCRLVRERRGVRRLDLLCPSGRFSGAADLPPGAAQRRSRRARRSDTTLESGAGGRPRQQTQIAEARQLWTGAPRSLTAADDLPPGRVDVRCSARLPTNQQKCGRARMLNIYVQ